jgi:vitamin K-dependent gamma-carboxylase
MLRRDAIAARGAAIELIVARLRERLGGRVDIASLAAFRILFGLLMCGAALRFILKGWIEPLLLAPAFHFTYPGFGFVRPWPGAGMYLHFGALALLGLGIALGFRYRACCIGFFLAFAYVELIDQALYLNHYYLVSLLAALLALLPAGRAFSVDVRGRPGLECRTIPCWVLLVLRIQVGLVYFFAGIAKLNHDWLFEAQPLRIWLTAHGDWPLIGRLLAAPSAAFVASWCGAVFDLTIVAFLSWRRTRRAAFITLVGFHFATGLLFPIGIFPWLMTLAATLFFAPDWPRRLMNGRVETPSSPSPRPWCPPRWLAPLLTAHCVVQLLIPLTQHLRGGDSAWTMRGFNFAWNVMVAEKTGYVSFKTRDRASGEELSVEPRSFLAPFQEFYMAQDPELIAQAARFVAAQYAAHGRQVAVFADARAALNGHPARPLVDPRLDLTKPLPSGWILARE